MVNKASQELTGVYTKRFENIIIRVILAWDLLFPSPRAGRGAEAD